MDRFRQTSYKDLVFARGGFLSVVGKNTQFRARFRQTSYKDLVFARGDFLSVVGAQNESLRLITIYDIKLHIWELNSFARFASEPKNKSKGSI